MQVSRGYPRFMKDIRYTYFIQGGQGEALFNRTVRDTHVQFYRGIWGGTAYSHVCATTQNSEKFESTTQVPPSVYNTVGSKILAMSTQNIKTLTVFLQNVFLFISWNIYLDKIERSILFSFKYLYAQRSKVVHIKVSTIRKQLICS